MLYKSSLSLTHTHTQEHLHTDFCTDSSRFYTLSYNFWIRNRVLHSPEAIERGRERDTYIIPLQSSVFVLMSSRSLKPLYGKSCRVRVLGLVCN